MCAAQLCRDTTDALSRRVPTLINNYSNSTLHKSESFVSS
ncbi:hypothetical protein PSPO01_15503 [Paraphaeosphaeria sporulosa]